MQSVVIFVLFLVMLLLFSFFFCLFLNIDCWVFVVIHTSCFASGFLYVTDSYVRLCLQLIQFTYCFILKLKSSCGFFVVLLIPCFVPTLPKGFLVSLFLSPHDQSLRSVYQNLDSLNASGGQRSRKRY